MAETANQTYNVSFGGNLTNSTSRMFFDFNIADRFHNLLNQPHYIIALIFGCLGIILNVISILAITRMHRNLTAHFRFIMSLAMSDILVGMTAMLHVINHIANPTFGIGYGPWAQRVTARCAFMFIKALNTTSLNITLLNLMGMAIDHFLAILRPLHYPTLMDRSRATGLLASFWVLAIVCGFSDFLSAYPKYIRYTEIYNYCEFIFLTKYQEEYPLFAIAIICFCVMTFTYVSMFRAIRRRHLNMGPVRHDVQRNKKALFTTLLILGTFIVCWLPTCLFQIIMIIAVKIDKSSVAHLVKKFTMADRYLYDLLILNTILDPIIYAVRMREVQLGYRRLFNVCYRPFKKDRQYNMEASHTTVMVESDKRSFHMSLRSNVMRVDRQ